MNGNKIVFNLVVLRGRLGCYTETSILRNDSVAHDGFAEGDGYAGEANEEGV